MVLLCDHQLKQEGHRGLHVLSAEQTSALPVSLPSHISDQLKVQMMSQVPSGPSCDSFRPPLVHFGVFHRLDQRKGIKVLVTAAQIQAVFVLGFVKGQTYRD